MGSYTYGTAYDTRGIALSFCVGAHMTGGPWRRAYRNGSGAVLSEPTTKKGNAWHEYTYIDTKEWKKN